MHLTQVNKNMPIKLGYQVHVYTSRYNIIMKQLDVINFKSFAKELSNMQHYVVSQLERKTYGSKTCN